MKGLLQLWMVGTVSVALTGCARISSQVVEKPRVDQELQGNRGYLVGSAPAAAPRKSTRQMIETNIELPTADEMNPWRTSKKAEAPQPFAAPQAMAPASPAPRQQWEEPEERQMNASMVPAMPMAEPTSYTVKKGDSLEKISKKVYGSSKHWRKIYDANRATLKSPDRIRVGQKLSIPHLEIMPEGQDRSTDEYK